MNRADAILYDSAWTIGVEYTDEDNEYNDKEEESEEKMKYLDLESNSSNEDSLVEWSRQSDSDSKSESYSEDNNNNNDSTDINEQVYVLDGCVSTAGV